MTDRQIKNARILEAFGMIDEKYIGEVAVSLNLDDFSEEPPMPSIWKSLKPVLILAACLVLMSAVVPVVSQLIANFPAGILSETTAEGGGPGYAGNLSDSFDEISDEDFLSLVDSYDNSIYQSLYELNGEKYGRVISSSKSRKDAVKVCTRHFTDKRYPTHKNTVVDCKVIYESDILYGIYVKWEVQGHFYDENVISFKKDIADITVWNVVYGDKESYEISTNAEEQIEQIVLYLFHNKYYGNKILDYEMLSAENEYVIMIYSYNIYYGDWGVPDKYYLLKHAVTIDKRNGDVSFQEPIVIKKVYR